ncbi:MAG: PilZ domain-containing protein [Alphaproteobacteria bacterium]|uniref:PilZ domain-containing protein n=1 Tax=Candidatus Nitrobium versatile TaxID=2884831 RepID=A0A953J7J9_9BACT|nr:PilZ domain-containing protein [Candidatus Nitrobium versatile]
MKYELVHRPKPIAIEIESRDFRRFGETGDVVLKSPSCNASGQLVNISMNGLLGRFHHHSALPGLFGKVAVGVRLHGEERIFKVYGTVVRIQIAGTDPDSEYIEFAVKFSGLIPQEKHELKALVHTLRGRARKCPYF